MNPNWNWEQVSAYLWGSWKAQRPHIKVNYGKITNPFWWKGFANGTVDYWLKRKGLK